jgi:hypothetical protein
VAVKGAYKRAWISKPTDPTGFASSMANGPSPASTDEFARSFSVRSNLLGSPSHRDRRKTIHRNAQPGMTGAFE